MRRDTPTIEPVHDRALQRFVGAGAWIRHTATFTIGTLPKKKPVSKQVRRALPVNAEPYHRSTNKIKPRTKPEAAVYLHDKQNDPRQRVGVKYTVTELTDIHIHSYETLRRGKRW